MKNADQTFIHDITAYVKTHPRYDEMTKEEAIEATLEVLLVDLGAANAFLTEDLVQTIFINITSERK